LCNHLTLLAADTDHHSLQSSEGEVKELEGK